MTPRSPPRSDPPATAMRDERRAQLLRLLETKASRLGGGWRLSTAFTVTQLAYALGTSVRTVKRDLAALERDGLLQRERNPDAQTRGRRRGRLQGQNRYLLAPRCDQGVCKTAGRNEGPLPSTNSGKTAGRNEWPQTPVAPQTHQDLRAKTDTETALKSVITGLLVGRPQTDETADADTLTYRGHSLTGSLEDFHAAIDALDRDTCNGGICGGGRHCRRHTRRLRAAP